MDIDTAPKTAVKDGKLDNFRNTALVTKLIVKRMSDCNVSACKRQAFSNQPANSDSSYVRCQVDTSA